METRDILNQMICGHHQQYRMLVICLRGKCGNRNGRRGVSPYRFEYLQQRFGLNGQQLFRREKAVLVVADHQMRCHIRAPFETQQRFLKQSVFG